MEINKNNYQVWISDYYDKSLGEAKIAMLNDFLDLNPELRDEFNSYESLILHPDISFRMDKTALRKELVTENKDAIEHCALALSEDDLDDGLRAEFAELMEHSAEAKSEAAIYASLKLRPGNTGYPDKIKLKRIPFTRGFGRTAIRVLAVAASLALLISLSVLLPSDTKRTFTYNTAYLLPFNNIEENAYAKAPEHSAIINAGRLALKDINIKERSPVKLTVEEEREQEEIILQKNPFLSPASLLADDKPEFLLAMKTAEPIILIDPEQDLSPRQFIAMNFRKYLLKEDIDNTGKLKAYEVADVSIDGLNKLLGWDMAFEKEKTEDGRLTSFKFTSQLLNLDHKAKISAD